MGSSKDKGNKDGGLPTVREVYNGDAGSLWNCLCCPFACTIGLIYRSLSVFCFPCVWVLIFRLTRGIHRFVFCCVGWPYEDETFFGASALGDHSEHSQQTAKQMEKDTDWVRAHELDAFKGKRPQLFEGKIEPDDLCQGAVGDCWLVAAMACASEHPDCIRNLFSAVKEYNPRGLYKVKIYDPVNKKFVKVTVDDRIPCKKGTKVPRFMSPNGNELWAMILEKAYAKYCGSYAALDGGFVLWAWYAMTGDNVFQMSKSEGATSSSKKKKKSKKKSAGGAVTWNREDMVPMPDKKDKRKCGFRGTDEVYTEDNLWTLLKKYDKQKALLSASIGKTDYGKFAGPNGEQLLEGEGLVAGHAYSIIQAIEVTDIKKISMGVGDIDISLGADLTRNAKKFRLVQLRNPWGTFEWKGDWSDQSKLWKKHPNVAKAVKFVEADDGAFWMTFDDFKQFYTRINVCDRTTFTDVSLDINEDSGCCGIAAGWLCGCANFWICCKGARNLYCGHRTTDETLDAKEGCCSCGV